MAERLIELRSDAFVADYFTAEEQPLVARASSPVDGLRLLAPVSSGKESALKALREGLRLDTRCVIVMPVDAARREGEDSE
jgi:4'-phosphopantetheinyl transferase